MTRLLLLLVVFFSTDCWAQKHNPAFNTIGYDYKNKREKNTFMDDVTDEDSLIDIHSDSITNSIKCVALPLKKIVITSPFGIRKDPLNKKIKKMHSGLDLRASYENVFSMLPGIVTNISYSYNGGYFVTINHKVCVCSYLHLSKIKVYMGQYVRAGDIIAVSGNSGKRTTAPHLHISCRWENENGKYFNPLIIINFVTSKLNTY